MVVEKTYKIIVTGANGLLGKSLTKILSHSFKVISLTHKDMDITQKKEIISKIKSIRADALIHTAAYTDVEGCEIRPEYAYKVNARGTKNIAQGCKKVNTVLFYISTDYIFSGKKNSPYLENDRPYPLNIYGKTKLEGEKYIREILRKFFIIRTSWLFGEGGKNFVDTIIKLSKNKKTIEVVNDQIGSPTYTLDLSLAIKNLLSLLYEGRIKTSDLGIYHITNKGEVSWYDFACEIVKLIKADCQILPTSSKKIPLKAKRPRYSVLSNTRYQKLTHNHLRSWQEALRVYLKGDDNS